VEKKGKRKGSQVSQWLKDDFRDWRVLATPAGSVITFIELKILLVWQVEVIG
jgi:hypothetical protein